jgi:predicted dehydrogenase
MPVPESLNYNMWLGPAPWAPYTLERVHFWWRFITDYGGGEITDRGAHIIDLAQFINQTDDTGPVEIIAEGSKVGNGLYNCFIEYAFECRYEKGTKIIGSSKGERGLKLVGTDGWIFIHIHGGQLTASDPRILQTKIGPEQIHVERSPGHHRNFLDSVKLRRKTVANEEIGHRTATICHLLNIAMESGETLKWDPQKEIITNSTIAEKMVHRPMRPPWSI